MSSVAIRFFGSGDAFGNGGRLQSCIMVDAGEGHGLLIDCGATALTGMKRSGFDSSHIGAIAVSHLHGDHFGGLPYLIKEIQVSGTRTEPLTIAGPEGLEGSTAQLLGLLYPGHEDVRARFWPDFRVLPPGHPAAVGDAVVTAFPAVHSPLSHPLSLRIECYGKTIAYSGDTEWSDAIPKLSRGADLFICETFEYRTQAGNHMSYLTLLQHRHELDCRRVILTHLGDTMLERCGSLELECAKDGMAVEI